MFHKISELEKKWIRAREGGMDGGREGGREGEREGEREGLPHFVSKICWLTVPKNFPAETSSASQILFLVSKNVRDKGARVIPFSVNLFSLTIPNRFVEESFCVSECFGYRRKICLREEYHVFL